MDLLRPVIAFVSLEGVMNLIIFDVEAIDVMNRGVPRYFD